MSGPPAEHDAADHPRRRGLKVALFTLAATLLLLVGVGGFWHYRFGLPAKVDVFARVNDLTGELSDGLPYDSPDNAVVHYRTLFVEVLGESTAWSAWKDNACFDLLSAGEWDDPRLDSAQGTLASLLPALAALDRAADAPGYRPRYSASGDVFHPSDTGPEAGADAIIVPHLSPLKQIGEVNAAALRAAANENDWNEVVRRACTGLRHGRHVAGEPSAIMALVGYTIELFALSELRYAALEQQPPAAVCDQLLVELDAVGAPSLAPQMRGEAAIFPGMVRVMMRQHIDDASPVTIEFWQRSFQLPPASATLRDTARYFSAMERWVETPYAMRAAAAPPDPGAAAWIMPDFVVCLEILDSLNTERAATRIILLLEKHHALTGVWPGALDEVMPLEQTLEPNTGEPFVYARTPDGPLPFSLRAPDAAAPFLGYEADRNFTRPRKPLESERRDAAHEESAP